MALVKYMTEPQHESRLPLFIPTGLSNKKAIAIVGPKLQEDTPISPRNRVHALELNAPFWVENSDALTQRFNAWLAR
jgi:putative spermidine/putrescine transport system substrate-binding protein